MSRPVGVRQPFVAHLQELRRRLMWSAALLLLGATAGYYFRTFLIGALQHPLGQPLFYNSPAGAFDFSMRISFLVGLVVAVPAIIYNLVRFIEPALKSRLRTPQLITLVCLSFALALGGLAFAYWVVLPLSLHFFADFSTAQIKPLISAKDYLSFVITCLTTFLIMFQIPLVLLFIDRITPLPPRKLRHFRRHVIVASLVIAVILPFTYDPITQFVIAIPMITLYELSIILISIAHRRRERQALRQLKNSAVLQPVIQSVAPTIDRPLREFPASVSGVEPLAGQLRPASNLLDLRNHHVSTHAFKPVPKMNVIDLRTATD